MSDFDIGFLLFYVFVGVVLIPIAYMLDKRREEEAIKRALRFHEMRHFEGRKFNMPCDYPLNPVIEEVMKRKEASNENSRKS
jgi:hypothetical protein|tara:strand:- start:3672 stop:3917 length:246 start_codon:yes stop_codon:yes gene_type:complete